MSLAEDIAALTAEIATLSARRADLLLRLREEQHAAKVQRLVPRVRKMPPEIKAALRQDVPPVDVYMSLAKRHLIIPNQTGWSKAGRAIREALALIDAEDAQVNALRSALEHAPATAPPGPEGLTGWGGDFEVCERCAARLTARGCGYLLHGFVPMWGEPVVCALAEQHTPLQGTVNGAPIDQWLASCPPDDPAAWVSCPACRSPLRRDGKGCTSWQCPSKGARNP